MGLIADIAGAFAAAIGVNAALFRSAAETPPSALLKLAEAAQKVWEGSVLSDITKGAIGLVRGLDDIAEFSVEALEDPQTFMSETFGKWSLILNNALALLNVDAPPGPAVLNLGDPSVARELLAGQSEAAQQRVTAAITAINSIVLVANGISVAAEMVTIGNVKSIAEAVQSWIWANGLGQLSSMAYQPQLSASVIPWLNRLYAARSQAQLPGESDLIRFQLREVFEETRRAELLEFPSSPTFDGYMAERGLSKYWADSYWAAHWVLPSIGQLNEMLHRGEIDIAEWERFVRFNDFDPSSIDRLRAIIYSPFTRVDARRMHKLGVLNDVELLQAYADIGYFAPTVTGPDGREHAVEVADPDFTVHKAQALVVWTKMFNALPTLRARFRNGHIDSDELLDELRATGMPADKARELWETIAKVEAEERVSAEKQLTRGLIARAWKKRTIGFVQAVFLLRRLGWSEAESELILRVQDRPVSLEDFQGSPLGNRLVGELAMIMDDESGDDGV